MSLPLTPSTWWFVANTQETKKDLTLCSFLFSALVGASVVPPAIIGIVFFSWLSDRLTVRRESSRGKCQGNENACVCVYIYAVVYCILYLVTWAIVIYIKLDLNMFVYVMCLFFYFLTRKTALPLICNERTLIT